MVFPVHITDKNSNGYEYNETYFHALDSWAQEYCDSYLGFTVVDVQDVSYEWDEIAEYQFRDERDALVFTLKWKDV